MRPVHGCPEASQVTIGNEHGLEVFYNIGVTRCFHIAPDLQVIEPTGQAADAAVIVGLRTHINY